MEEKKTDSNAIPLQTLQGDPLEAFYQLGVHDRDGFKHLSHHLKEILRTHSSVMNFLTDGGLELAAAKWAAKETPIRLWLKSYAEGLQIHYHEALKSILLPEFLSSIHKWLPNLPLFGCSSCFAPIGPKNCAHIRILDFPLVGTFDRYQRALLTKFPQGPQVFSVGAEGLPLPALSAMNSEGLTLALHQKFSNQFDYQGTPIFELVTQLLHSDLHTERAIKKWLQEQKTITRWGLYLTLPHGEILEVDLQPEGHLFKKHHAKGVHYFNNIPLQNDDENYTPKGMAEQNKMRHFCAEKKRHYLESEKGDHSGLYRVEELLDLMSVPVDFTDHQPSDWKMDTCHATSLQICALLPSSGECWAIAGKAPKMKQESYLIFQDLWSSPQVSWSKAQPPASFISHYQKLHAWWGEAISAYDLKDLPRAYHCLQMGMEEAQGHPFYFILKMYFCSYQYIHHDHQRDRAPLLEDFQSLKDQLPPYLHDHLLLFIFRLEKRIIGKTTISADQFQFPRLKSIFEWENKRPAYILGLLQKWIFPRPDTLDFIYGYKP